MPKQVKNAKIVVMVTQAMFEALHALADAHHDGNVSQLARELFIQLLKTQETKGNE